MRSIDNAIRLCTHPIRVHLRRTETTTKIPEKNADRKNKYRISYTEYK